MMFSSVDEYKKYMGKSGVYGTDFEVAMFFRCFKKNVAIYHKFKLDVKSSKIRKRS